MGETLDNQIELEIQDMLLSETEETFIADTLIRRWSSIQHNDNNSHAIVQFLIQCRFYASLCDHVAQRLLKYQEIPWQDIAYILRKFDSYIDQEVVDLFFFGLQEIRQLQLLSFMSHNENFINVHVENDWEDQLKNVQSYLAELWGDLSRKENTSQIAASEISQAKTLHVNIDSETYNDQTYNKNNQLTDVKTINVQEELQNAQVGTFITHIKEKTKIDEEYENEEIETTSLKTDEKAKEISQNKTQLELGPRLKEELLIHHIFQQVEDEFQGVLKKAEKEVLPSFLIQAKQQPHYAYDLAVSLFMMGVYKETLQSLDQYDKYFISSKSSNLNNRSSDSLKLELYSVHKYYLELLKHVDKMLKKYINEDPDIILSLIYFKAKALWGLNKNYEAIELMSEIVKQKPHFRCADLILSKWKELVKN